MMKTYEVATGRLAREIVDQWDGCEEDHGKNGIAGCLEIHLASALRAQALIVTEHVYPPIPTRSNDWCAYRDGSEESGPYGWGETKEKAVTDLLEQEQEHE